MADEQSVEQQAREQGWKPKEEYSGDASRWVDAPTYLKRGEELLPILKANDTKHRAEISGLRVEVMGLKEQLQASIESIEALKEFNSEAAKHAAKQERKALIAAVEAARKDGDVEAATQLSEQLEEHNDAIRTAEAAPKPAPKPATPAPQADSPAYAKWKSDNPWFGTDDIKSDLAVAVSMRLRRSASTKDLPEEAFLRRVTEEVERVSGGNPARRAESKTDSGRPSAGGAGGSGGTKTYEDLPREAKEACERFAKRLVGPGKTWTTAEAYRKHYIESFDWS